MELAVLAGELDRLLAADPFSYSDKESIIELHRLADRLDAVVARAVVSFDAGGEWAPDGAKTAAAWIDTRCHCPKRDAKAELRLGRAMATMAVVEKAWCDGDIGTAQVARLVRARSVRTEECFGRDEAVLVQEAKRLKFEAFSTAMDYWENLADPDGAAEADLVRQERRDTWLTPTPNRTWTGHMHFDQVNGAIVYDRWSSIEKELFEEDWAEAKERLGREPKPHELRRTSAQRRADAMTEMAVRAGTAPPDGRRPRPLVTFLIGWDTLQARVCELANAMVVAPETVFPYMEWADFERAVFAPGKRIEVSVKSRLFKGATKRAIELRDRQCTHEYCDLPADRCEIDHIVSWDQGGLTQQENGRVLCGFHNRLRNGREPPEHGPG